VRRDGDVDAQLDGVLDHVHLGVEDFLKKIN
jgi:hypothetical protein